MSLVVLAIRLALFCIDTHTLTQSFLFLFFGEAIATGTAIHLIAHFARNIASKFDNANIFYQMWLPLTHNGVKLLETVSSFSLK